jgi:hypothetical protein
MRGKEVKFQAVPSITCELVVRFKFRPIYSSGKSPGNLDTVLHIIYKFLYLLAYLPTYLFIYLLTYSFTESIPSWKAANCAAIQELDTSSVTVLSKPALYILLTVQIPNLMSIFLCLGPLSKESVLVRGFLWSFVTHLFFYCEELLAPHTEPPSWRKIPCQLSMTAYEIYSQLPSISGGHSLHPQPEDAPCRGNKWPT